MADSSSKDGLTRHEFLAHVGYIREDVAGVNDRLDTLNGRTRKLESAVEVLQRTENAQPITRKDLTVWILGASAVVGLIKWLSTLAPAVLKP